MRKLRLATGVLSFAALTGVRADEEMWLFNHPPVKLPKDKYRFDVAGILEALRGVYGAKALLAELQH